MKNIFPWSRFLLLAGLVLLFSLVFFPLRSNRLQELTGLEEPTFDVRLFYTPQDVYDILPAYTPQARWVYAVSELTLDLAFPLLYTAFLRLLINHLAAGLPAAAPGAAWLVRLPYLLLAADLLENTGITLLLLSYPPPIPALTVATALASALKWLAGLACVGSIVAGSVWLEIRSLRKK